MFQLIAFQAAGHLARSLLSRSCLRSATLI